MTAVADDRDLRLARRIKVGARLVFYPLGLALIAYAWHAHHAGAEDQPDASWRGTTSQGRAAWATVDGRWLNAFGIEAALRCDHGASGASFTWTPSPDITRQRGEEVTAYRPPMSRMHENGWRERYTARLRMVAGAHPHGTASVSQTWSHGHQRVVCRSGPITFSLRRRP